MPQPDGAPRTTERTNCVIVGGGPGGLLLGLLLARAGVPLTLLEAHQDFDRDFRGDTVHPSTLEALDQIGLAERLHELPHAKMRALRIITPSASYTMAETARLRTRFPYVMLMPQARFLDFLAAEARRYPHFRLVLGADVRRLVEEGGVIQGVRYQAADGWHEVRAPLTVAADGRFSRLRKLAGIETVGTAPPMDVLWFRLPRRPDDPHDEGALLVGDGHFLVLLSRETDWQAGYAFPKGGFQRVKAAGLEALQRATAELAPWLGDRVEVLRDWHQMAVLSVESSRARRWWRPGLLLIGDAAHVMSPVGGVGINYAIGDAVEATNVLADALREGRAPVRLLQEVQRRREWPVRVIQFVQGFMQKAIVGQALSRRGPFRMPLPLRLLLKVPILRDLPARMIAFGPRRVRLEHPQERPPVGVTDRAAPAGGALPWPPP
jgi:2-polyprenyl-6-methoxyphenol hydroxylase-like FAD-dependent oxidoreductase